MESQWGAAPQNLASGETPVTAGAARLLQITCTKQARYRRVDDECEPAKTGPAPTGTAVRGSVMRQSCRRNNSWRDLGVIGLGAVVLLWTPEVHAATATINPLNIGF